MTKFKRELVPGSYLTAADMLSILSKQHFKAAAVEGRILLPVQLPVAWLLDSCCVGRSAMKAAEPLSLLEGSSSGAGDLSAVVVDVAGVNTAEEALWQQFRQHQQVLLQQQRKAGKAARRAAAAAAAAGLSVDDDSSKDDAGVVRLVQLSCQEAVFLSTVLRCCEVLCCSGNHSMQHVAGGCDSMQQSPQKHLPGASALQELLQQEQQQGPEEVSEQVPNGQRLHPQQQQQQQGAGDASVLGGDQLWQWCCHQTPGGAGAFAPQYAAYHHLRCLGWLPLPGLPYGADYVLYQLHPELSHSDFVVTVMVESQARHAPVATPELPVDKQQVVHHAQQSAGVVREQEWSAEHVDATGANSSGGVTVPDGSQQLISQPGQLESVTAAGEEQLQGAATPSSTQLAWLDACIMHRLARQVLKEMMLLYVVVPSGLSLLSFDCIHHMQVREVLVQRWVPSEHRE